MMRRSSRPLDARAAAAAARHTPAGEALTRIAGIVTRLHETLLGAREAMTAPAGQSTARWQVLATIESAPLSVSEIAALLGLARQSVQRVADLLERDGLSAYEPNPEHRRAKLLRLTPAGRAALQWLQASQREWANAVGSRLREREVRQACVVLERLLHAVTESPRSP